MISPPTAEVFFCYSLIEKLRFRTLSSFNHLKVFRSLQQKHLSYNLALLNLFSRIAYFWQLF